jgi:hypothetical protein
VQLEGRGDVEAVVVGFAPLLGLGSEPLLPAAELDARDAITSAAFLPGLRFSCGHKLSSCDASPTYGNGSYVVAGAVRTPFQRIDAFANSMHDMQIASI